MSLLWVTAASQGEPPEDTLHATHHDYLRAQYEDDPTAGPGTHDHYVPMNIHQWGRHVGTGEPYTGAWTMERHEGDGQRMPYCTGYGPGECKHRPTREYMQPIAADRWDREQHALLDPEGYAQRQRQEHQKAKEWASGFLSDYKLDHPDRVFDVHPETGELHRSYDPRLDG